MTRAAPVLLRATVATLGVLAAACTGASGAGAARPVDHEASPSHVATPQATIFSPGVISNAREQWRLSFTPDGKTAYFAESPGFFPLTRRATIHVSELQGTGWSEPRVASFSGTHSDIDPFVSPDGKRLYFSSIRPVNGTTRGDLDVWMVERTAEGWSEAIRLGDEVNSPADELYPSASADGTLYFASGPLFPQRGRHFDIFRATRSGDRFRPREALGPAINTTPSAADANLQSAWDFNPEISIDGATLVFTSLRPGFGLGDLYVSHFRNGEWSRAQNLGPAVNSAADEYHPTLSRDRRALFFIRRVSPGDGNLFVIATSAIAALEP